jgi:starvation-inducible outer membrane lipoprotein
VYLCTGKNHDPMRKITGLLLTLCIVLGACSTPKPYYKTAKGKKKQKYYNDIQFGGKSASQMKKP